MAKLDDLYAVQKIPIRSYPPRLYLNGFPKSGLHLLQLMMGAIVSPSTVGRNGTEWLGTFGWHSWTNEPLDLLNITRRLSLLQRGDYLMGHLGHFAPIESVMYWGGIGQIMIVRDLRDVAVSSTHHIMSDNPILNHAHKDVYRMLGGFDEILEAVIVGMGPYPGLFERWEKYVPWLDIAWVSKIAYEDLVREPERWARELLKYALANGSIFLEKMYGSLSVEEETQNKLVEMMVERGRQTHLSATFRKGRPGEWQEAFTQRHKDLFKERDRGWLIRLGYAESDDW